MCHHVSDRKLCGADYHRDALKRSLHRASCIVYVDIGKIRKKPNEQKGLTKSTIWFLLILVKKRIGGSRSSQFTNNLHRSVSRLDSNPLMRAAVTFCRPHVCLTFALLRVVSSLLVSLQAHRYMEVAFVPTTREASSIGGMIGMTHLTPVHSRALWHRWTHSRIVKLNLCRSDVAGAMYRPLSRSHFSEHLISTVLRCMPINKR